MSNTEKYVDPSQGQRLAGLLYGISRRVQRVAKIEAHRPHWGPIANAHTDCLRIVVKVARRFIALRRAVGNRLLMDAQHAADNVVRRIEYIAHIVEENETQVVSHVRQQYRWSTDLDVIDEQTLPADSVAGLGIARARLVDGEAA